MPLYTKKVTVPASTPITEAVAEELEIKEPVIERIEVYFPPGCCLLVHAAVFHGNRRIWPDLTADWAVGHGETVGSDVHVEFEDVPVRLTLRAWSEDEAFDHTIVFRIFTQPVEKAAPWDLFREFLLYALGRRRRRGR